MVPLICAVAFCAAAWKKEGNMKFFDNENCIMNGTYYIRRNGINYLINTVNQTYQEIDNMPDDVEEKSADCFSDIYCPFDSRFTGKGEY